ncbi:MotA/TolQ/ExbB proton channel family protein [Thermus tenuipuniceus]|uniref:MotA/TolQ/ExbB proton channel family protein n=1 Tax=Thermus tenuipuniceus TaxID=2078690 RepID=UPI000CF87A06|nr:MotA/TolQ/ExbB proton channel family protein [Thermus tenuipuniceus]
MDWGEVLAVAGPLFWVLAALSVYVGYLILYASFLLKREGRVEAGVLDRLEGLAQLAPLVGLLGTTWGMIQAFLALGGEGSPEGLAKGIAEALVNTGMGLLVAVVAYGGRVFLGGRR